MMKMKCWQLYWTFMQLSADNISQVVSCFVFLPSRVFIIVNYDINLNIAGRRTKYVYSHSTSHLTLFFISFLFRSFAFRSAISFMIRNKKKACNNLLHTEFEKMKFKNGNQTFYSIIWFFAPTRTIFLCIQC